MAINAPYTNGAVLSNGGRLQVTDQGKVDNLNAEKLQGRTPGGFIQTNNGFVTTGLTQDGTGIAASGITVNNTNVRQTFDEDSVIKIGNTVVKASNNGGILIGIE